MAPRLEYRKRERKCPREEPNPTLTRLRDRPPAPATPKTRAERENIRNGKNILTDISFLLLFMMLKFDNTTANMQTALGIIHSNTIIINVNTLTKYFHPTSPPPSQITFPMPLFHAHMRAQMRLESAAGESKKTKLFSFACARIRFNITIFHNCRPSPLSPVRYSEIRAWRQAARDGLSQPSRPILQCAKRRLHIGAALKPEI